MLKKPFVTKEQLEAICEKYQTPFHLYDEAGIRKMPYINFLQFF